MSEITPNSSASRPKVTAALSGNTGKFGPYSRAIDRGAIGGAIDGRSREGRFLGTVRNFVRG
jgi:hypothetical protein